MRKNNLRRGIAVLLMLMMLFSDLQIPDFAANLTYAESENEISTSQPADSSVTEPKETQADTAEPQAEIASEAVTVSGDDSTTAASTEAAATATPAPAAEATAEAGENTTISEPTVEATEDTSTPEATAETGENDSTPETTEEPAAEVTVEPTEVCNTPSAEEATVEPSEEPTPEPTVEPTPEPVELVLGDLQASALKINLGESAAWSFDCAGADSVSYTISNSNGETVASGALEESFSFSFTPNTADIYTIRVCASNATQNGESSALLCVKDGELNFSAATAQRYAVADDTAICYELSVSGGIAPYTLSFIVKHGGKSVNEQTITLGTAGAQSFSYMPTAYGEHSVEMSVRDAYGETKAETASMPVAVRESESESTWKKSVQNVTLTGDWRKDVVAIAQSQLGYMESERDFIIREDGTRQGYTRYGAWYGAAYEEWCAMFVSFCLNYAGISENDIPQEAGCERWLKTFKSLKAYAERDEYQPQPGDIVFFNNDSHADADHVGIVESVSETQINTIEGNSGKRVQRKSYALSDVRIMGYVSMEKLMECAGVLEQFQPTPEPTAEATAEPTIEPSEEPTEEPTIEPTVEPTEVAESFDFTVEVSVSPAEAELGETIIFTAETVGNAPENLNWQWQYSTDGQIWKDIEGATEQTYTVVATMHEFLHYFRAVAGLPGGEGIVMPLSLTQEAEEAAEPTPQAEEIASAPLKASMRATGDAIYWNPYASPTFDTEGDIIVAAGDDNNSGLAADSPVCSLSRLEALVETYPAAVVYCMNLYDVYSDETTVTFAANATKIEYYESDIAGASHKGNFFSIWEDATITLQNLTINHNALELNGGTLRMGTGMHVTGHIYLSEISEDFCPILSAEANNENEGKYKIAFNPNTDLDRVGIAPGDLRDLLELDAEVMDGWELYIENGNTYARRVLSYTAIYLDGVNGNDANKGNETTCPVKTFARAKALMQENPTVVGIYVMDTVTISDSQICNLFDINAEHPVVLRYSSCKNPLFKISGNAEVTFNFQLDGQEGSQNMIELSAGTLTLDNQMYIHDFDGIGVYQTGGTLKLDGANIVYRENYGLYSTGGAVSAQSATVKREQPTAGTINYKDQSLYVSGTAKLDNGSTFGGLVKVIEGATLDTSATISTVDSKGSVTVNGGSVSTLTISGAPLMVNAGTITSAASTNHTATINGGSVGVLSSSGISNTVLVNNGSVSTINSNGVVNVLGGNIGSIYTSAGAQVSVTSATIGSITGNGIGVVIHSGTVTDVIINYGTFLMESGSVTTLKTYVENARVSGGMVNSAYIFAKHLYAEGGSFERVYIYSASVLHTDGKANFQRVDFMDSGSANGGYIALSGKPGSRIDLYASTVSTDGRVVVRPEGDLTDAATTEYIACFNLLAPANERFVLAGETPNIVLRIQGVYISTDGDDTNNGLSKETPVRTFARAGAVLEEQSSDFKPYIIVLSTEQTLDGAEHSVGVVLEADDIIQPTRRSGISVVPYSSMEYVIYVPQNTKLSTSGVTLDGSGLVRQDYIYVQNGGVTLGTNTLLENCSNCAVYMAGEVSEVEVSASAKITGCGTAVQMEGGTLNQYGNIQYCSYASVIMNDGILNLYGGISDGNSIGVDMEKGTLNITGSITDCKGMGVDMEDGEMTLAGSIKSCGSTGVDMCAGTLILTGSISGCDAYGLNIYSGTATVSGSISGCTSRGINMQADGGSIVTLTSTGTVSSCQGGGIKVNSSATLNFSGRVQNNGSRNSNGVILLSDNGAGICVEAGAFANFNGGTITGNMTRGNGGGLYIVSEEKDEYDLSNMNISSNTAGKRGGGVFFACAEKKLKLNATNLSNNAAEDEKEGMGGALYIENGNAVYNGCNTENSIAPMGSALYLGESATFAHESGVLSGNAYVYGQYTLTTDGEELPVTEHIELRKMGHPLELTGTKIGYAGKVQVHVGSHFLEQVIVKGTETVPAKLINFTVVGVVAEENGNNIAAQASRDVYWDPDPNVMAESTNDENTGGSPYTAVATWERAIELLRQKQDPESHIVMCSTCLDGGVYDGLVTDKETGETWSAVLTRGVNVDDEVQATDMFFVYRQSIEFSNITIDGTMPSGYGTSSVGTGTLIFMNANKLNGYKVVLKRGTTIQNNHSGISAGLYSLYIEDGVILQNITTGYAMACDNLIMTGGCIRNNKCGCITYKSADITGGEFSNNTDIALRLSGHVYIDGGETQVCFYNNSGSDTNYYNKGTIVVSSTTETAIIRNVSFEKNVQCINLYNQTDYAITDCNFIKNTLGIAIVYVRNAIEEAECLIADSQFFGNTTAITLKGSSAKACIQKCLVVGGEDSLGSYVSGIAVNECNTCIISDSEFEGLRISIQALAGMVILKGNIKISSSGCERTFAGLYINTYVQIDICGQIEIDFSDVNPGYAVYGVYCRQGSNKASFPLTLKNINMTGINSKEYKCCAFYMGDYGTYTKISDVTIENCDVQECDVALYIAEASALASNSFNLKNVRFKNNTYGVQLNTFRIVNRVLNIDQSEIAQNKVGIFFEMYTGMDATSVITVNINADTVIRDNSSFGIYAKFDNAKFKDKKWEIGLNVASDAKIINNLSGGIGIYSNGYNTSWKFKISGEIRGNCVNGGIHMNADYNSSLVLDHAIIKDNYSSSNGGGVLMSSTDLTIKNATFTGNTAKNGGGAVYVADGSAAKITNCSFTENSAPLGGAIYNGGTLNLAGNYMKDNVSTSDGNLSNGVYNGSTTLNIAGGLYNIQDNVYLADVSYPAQLTGVPRSGSTITFAVNTASGQYKSGSTVVQKTSYPTNAAQYLRYTRAGQPGVVLAKGNESNIIMKTAIFVDGQKGSDSNGGTNPNDALRTMEAAFEKAKENSGVIFVCGEMELSGSWSETYGVEVERYTGFAIGGVDIYPAYNGNLFRIKNGSSFTISGGSYRIAGRHLDSDTNKTAGALFVVENGATLNINAATTLEGNIRQSGNGGAIENAGTVNVNADLTIDSVKAECGGAIYNVGTLEIAEGKTLRITNASAANGGAIHNTGSVNLNGTLAMNSNTAVQNGDAMYQAGDFTIASGNAEINTDGTVYLADEKPITVKDGAEGFKITNTTLNIDIDDAFDNRVYVDYGNTTPNGTTELARYSLSDRITATFLQETKTENEHLKLYLKQRSIVYVDENYTGGARDGYEQGRYADYPFTSLCDAYNYLKNGGGLIYLVSPVTISGNVTIGTAAYKDANDRISLNAGGVSIKRYSKPAEENNTYGLFSHDSNTDALFIVQNGAELILENIMLDGHSRAITSASDDYKYTIAPAVEANAPLVEVQAGGSATFKGTTLSNNNNVQEGKADAVHNAETVKIADGNAVSINGTVKLENEKFITVAGSESRASRVELLLEGVYDGRVIAQYDSAPADTELGRYVLEEEVLRNYKLKIEETKIVLRQRGVYYVSDTGDDANAGTTPNAPLKTIKAAYQKMADDNDGGSIYIVGSVTLSGDVTLSQDCYLDADGKVELENGTTRILRYSQPGNLEGLTGYDVASHTGYMLTVAAGASLTLENITIDGHGEAQSTGAQNTTAPGVDAQAAMLFVKGSLIVQDGAQLVNNHNVSKSSSGGAVRIASTGSMEMSAGSIAGNTAAVGAGIFHYGTALEIYGEPEIGENQIIYLGTNQKISVTGVLNAPTMKVDFAVTDYVRLHVVADYVAGVTPDLEQFALCQQAIMKKRNLSLVRKDQQLLLEASYDVKWVLTGIEETDLPTKTGYGAEISATLKAQDTYALPESISVTVTDSEDATITLIPDTDYSYDAATGAVKIFAAAVTGNVTITAEAIQCFTREADVYLYAVDDAEKLSAGQSQTAELDLLGAELNIVPALLRNKTLNVESITAGDLSVTDVASIEAVKQTAGYTTANSTFAIGAQVNGGTETGIVKDAAISFGAEVTEAKLNLTLHNANAITTADTEESAPVVTVVLTSAQKDKLTLNIHIVRVPSSINATVPLVIVMKTNIDGGAYAFQDADNYKITNNSSMRVSLTEAKADSADENVLKAAGENDDLDNMVDSYKITLRQDIANKDIAAGEGYNPIHSITFSRLSFVTRLNTETEQYGVKAASITYKLEIPKDDPANP